MTRHEDGWAVESLSAVPGRPEERTNGWVRRLARETGARRVMVEYADDLLLVMPMRADGGGYVHDPDGQPAETGLADTAEVLSAAVRAAIANCR